MFDFLQGRVESAAAGRVVLQTGGVGWLVAVTARCQERLRAGQKTRLLVHLAVGESSLALYGFLDPLERRAFQRLLQVSGVGPALALNLLSAFSPAELRRVLQVEDLARLTSVKGVGRKTGERLLVELRDAFDDWPMAEDAPAEPGFADLLHVLQGLGFQPHEARDALLAARRELGDQADSQELLRNALRRAHTTP